MHPISGVGFCGPRSPTTSGLAPVLGAAPGSGAPGRRISRRLLDRRSSAPRSLVSWGAGMVSAVPDPRFVLGLDDPAADLPAVGGKGASLARLAAAGLPVPPGFHVTTEAYRR